MAKKTLNEAVVRRFQKLANVGTLNEMYEMREEEGDDAMADADAMAPPEDPMTDEDPMADESAGMDVEITNEEADILIQLGEKLSGAMAGEEEEMPADDMGGEEDMGEEDMGEEDIMEALRGINYAPSKSEVVNEVAKRVAKRLKTAKLHEAKLNRALGRKK